MAKAIAVLLAQALLIMPPATVASFAADQDNPPATNQPAPKKPKKPKTRSFHQSSPVGSAPRSLAAPPAMPAPQDDGGKPDDTIGGLPGQKPDIPDKQP